MAEYRYYLIPDAMTRAFPEQFGKQPPTEFFDNMPEFPAELLPSLLKADTTSRASNADILSFFSKTPLLIDRLRYIRDSYKVVFTELLLEDDTRVGFYKESNDLLVWQGSYLTRSAESHLSWHSVTAAISALVDNHELIAAIDPKKAVSQDEQLSFDLPENASRGDEVGTLEVDDIYSEEEQDEKIKAALPTYHYKEPQPDDGSHITEDDVNVIITRGSVFEGGKYRIYNHFQQKKTEKETVAFLKKEYGIGGFSWTFADGGSGFVSFDGKGFSILYDFKDDLRYEKKLKWKEVGKRLEYLVRMDRYLTDAEREKMPAWINRQTESKPLPPPIPDQKPVCEVGSTVYLENDQRFTVESIGQFDVHLRNEDFPLVGRAVSREQFQQLLDANPRNGGMVLSEQQRESLVQEQREQALSYIEDYLKDEFEITEPDFSDLTQIGLGYTTTEDEQHTIQVHADLEHCTISKFVDDTLYAQDTYASLEDMNRMALANLDFDSLMEVDINEIEEQEPEISADEPEESTFVSQVMQDVDRLAAREEPAEYDRTNYLAPYEPAVPEGPKAKFAVNVQAIRTLKEIEQRMASGGAPASEQEQDILAGYLGWGGLADAFDPGKDNWHTEYEQLKTLLTEDEYAAARESTLTAFYTPPAVIHAMYRALEHIGCVGGNVLEPSMGVGAFFGHRHSKFDTHNAKLYGVELDSLSGRIAQQLYQKAKIQITGYEKADLPDNFFDLAIGNVPFGQYQVSDRRYDKLHFQIHDYFLAKTVDKLRVGGIMAFITTSGTLDKKSEDVRQYLAARCDLIGAVRLPNTTFKSNAGTEVTSDILFLQKRGRVLEQDAPWIHVGETENGIPLNQYFIDHPEMVCGEMQMVSGPYGMRSTCVPNEQSPLAEQLDAALSTLHAEYTLVDEQEYAEEESGTIDADPNVRNFSYTVKDDVIYYRENSKMRVVKGGETALARIRALVPLRDTCRELIDAQLENFPDEYIQKLQARLNDQYDAYRKKYGLINSRGTASAFREDSGYFLLCSLEDLDDEGNFKGKTDMFTKRTIRPAQAVDHVDTAEESLALSLSEQGHVDLEYMSKLTGKTTETVIKDLTGIIFRDPVKVDADGNPIYLPADEYLSGNVREKLQAAKAVAANDPQFQINVAALEKVQPKDLEASEISVRLGATWIPAEYVQQFLEELLDAPYYTRRMVKVEFAAYTGSWAITNKKFGDGNIKATVTYGTNRANAYLIAENALNLRSTQIRDKVTAADGSVSWVLNKEATQAAQEKQRQICEQFQDWIFKEPERRQRLVAIYNDTAEIISLAAVYYQQNWPRSELLSAFSDNVPFTKFCRALAAYGLDVTARESAPYSCMGYGGCVNGYRSEGEVVSVKDYRLETHTCSEGDDACGQYDAAAEWHWNEGHAENESYTVWKKDGTHDVTVFFPIIFPDGATGSELSDLPEEYHAVVDGRINAADCIGDIVLDDSANLYKGELNDWFYTPDELTVTFTVVTGEGENAVSDDYEVTFSNATAIPWCPGELNDGQYGHYDLDCTIYLTGYDRYTDPETQAPNGADGGTGNLEALAESCDAGTLTRTIIKQDQYGNEYAGNAVSARYTKTITLPNGARGFQGWYKDGEDAYGNVEWASLLYRMDWEELYGIVDGIKCRATGSGMTEEELRQLFASLNIDATTARGQVVAFALSCQGKFVYAQPSSLRGGPGNPSVGINLDCSSFVQYCYWAQNLPFSAGSTAAYRNAADLVSISPSEVQPGDLRVVYASGGEQGHVQMALGSGVWIECCYGYGVAVNMSNAWMESRPCYYFRYAGF